jgi:hypothetical protein
MRKHITARISQLPFLALPLAAAACEHSSGTLNADSHSVLESAPRKRPHSSSTRGAGLLPVGIEDSLLFKSRTGELFIRLPYVEVHREISNDPKYNFQECVFVVWDSCTSLNNVVDTTTFRRVKNTSNYYVDKHFIYTDPWISYPGTRYFTVLGWPDAVSFLKDPEFARVGKTLYYRGLHVPGDTIPASGHYP